MATNSVESMLAGAHKTLANADKLTTSVEGSPTSHFGPKAIPSHISGVKAAPAHEYSQAPYSLGRELRAKQDNVDQYKASQ
jgi:hypothetical protein